MSSMSSAVSFSAMRPPIRPSRYSFEHVERSPLLKLRIFTGVLVAELSVTPPFYQRGRQPRNGVRARASVWRRSHHDHVESQQVGYRVERGDGFLACPVQRPGVDHADATDARVGLHVRVADEEVIVLLSVEDAADGAVVVAVRDRDRFAVQL